MPRKNKWVVAEEEKSSGKELEDEKDCDFRFGGDITADGDGRTGDGKIDNCSSLVA